MKKTISFREKTAAEPLFWENGKPLVPKRLSPDELFPPEPSEEDMSEKAPLAESGGGASTWAKIEPNLHINYEVPAFDRGGGIHVLVSGKMPYSAGHHVQFNGVLEATGIGDIFTMDHELIGSLRKFVYQELPRIDKFDKDLLDEIYTDNTRHIGMNVPIKSIYEYLRNNYPREFSRATKGRNITQEQLVDVIRRQREFYNKRKLAAMSLKTTAAAYNKNDLVSIDFQKLDRADRDALKKYNKNFEHENSLVFLKPKDKMRSVVVIKTDKGVLKAISVPNKALAPHENQADLVDQIEKENEEVYGRGNEGNETDSGLASQIYAKLGADKVLNKKEVEEAFGSGMFDDMSEDTVIKVMAGKNGTKLMEFYNKNRQNVDTKTKAKFIIFKIRHGLQLGNDEVDLGLKSMNKEQLKENPDLAMALIWHKLRNQTPMQIWEIEFLLESGKFNEQMFEYNERAFIDYYNYMIKQNKLDVLDSKLKRVIMDYKKQNNKPFSEIEMQDPVYRATVGASNQPAQQ